MYRIISVSRNVHRLLERSNVLAMAGFSVMSPRPEEASILAALQQVDAVVIGHSVEASLRQNIISDLRQFCPQCLICFVYAAPETAGEPLADVSLDVTSGPESLIVALQERLPRAFQEAS